MNEIIIQENYTLTQQIDKFIATIKRDLAPSTLKTYKSNIKVFIDWYKLNPPVQDIKEHLKEYRNYLSKIYTSAKSMNLNLSILRSFYRWLFEHNIIAYNPTSILKNFRVNTDVTRSALTETQLSIIFKHLDSCTDTNIARNRALFILAVMNGLRVNELSNIKIEDFGYEHGTPVFYLLRKGYTDKTNYTKLQSNVLEEMEQFIGSRTSGCLFQSRKGGKLTPDAISKILKGIMIDAGYKSSKITAHSLRHTYAILFLDAGGTIEQLMLEMNHKSINTTSHYLKSYNRSKTNVEISIAF